MNTRYVLLLILLSAACRRPSKQLGATLTPTSNPSQAVATPASPPIADYSRNLKASDEFVAAGLEPFWSLTINSSKNRLQFGTLTGDSLNTPVPQRIDDSNGSIRFAVDTEAGRLSVLFRPDSCVNAVSRQRADYRVEVAYKGKTYTGCGVSLRPITLLNDVWVLKSLNGKELQPIGARNELPRLELQLTEGRVTGTTGCNRLTGPLKADTRQIQFGPLATTRMACPGETGRLEGDLLEALSQPLSYKVNDGQLVLQRDGKLVMTLRKGD